MKSDTFNSQLALIKDETIRKWTKDTLENAPEYFWKAMASSTGKYHPACTCKEGGLVIHVKRAVYIANRICEDWDLDAENRDIVLSATILHDIAKTGKGSGTMEDYVNHPINAEKYFSDTEIKDLKIINDCIKYHMSKWSPESIKKPLCAYTRLELAVCTADYLASTKDLVTPVDTV